MDFEKSAGDFNSGKNFAGWENRRKSAKAEERRKKEEDLKQRGLKYSKEFLIRDLGLNADRINPENYTQEMKEKDLELLNSWLDFQRDKIDWLRDSLIYEHETRMEAAFTVEDREKLLDMYLKNLNFLNDQIKEKMDEYYQEKERVINLFLYKKDAEENEGGNAKNPGNEDAEDNEEDKVTETDPEQKISESEKKTLEIALQELEIDQVEYNLIIGKIYRLADSEIIRLATKIFKAPNDIREIKKAYRRCALEWHPDTGKSEHNMGVNDLKFRIANSLYGEYVRRFGK